MKAATQQRFYATARAMGLSDQRADFLCRTANGDSDKAITRDTGIKRPGSILCRAYDVLGAKHRAHAVAIVFEQILQEDVT